MRVIGNEVNVSLNGETSRGKNAIAADGALAGQASGFDKPQPFFNAAGLGAVAVMIQDAFAALIVITIQRPGLKLASRKLAFMHEQVKRMLVVIALFANGVKASDELRFRERRLFLRSLDG